MPLTDPARNGLSTYDSSPVDPNGNPYAPPSVGPPSDPTAAMERQRSSETMSKIVVPKDDRPPYYLRMMLSNYSRQSWLKVGTLSPVTTIELPIPSSLTDTQNVRWQADPIGEAGRFAMDAIGANRSTFSFADAASGVAGGAIRSASRVAGQVAGNFAGDIGSDIYNGALAGVGAALGLAINNYLTMMLQGPSYKVHEFAWRISPNSPEESDELVKLYNAVNNAQAPSLSDFPSSTFFKYPMIFELEFIHTSGTDMGERLYRFKPCVLQTSSWKFMPMGAAFYGETHSPESIEFGLSFVELEFWLNGDFGKPTR